MEIPTASAGDREARLEGKVVLTVCTMYRVDDRILFRLSGKVIRRQASYCTSLELSDTTFQKVCMLCQSANVTEHA